MRPLLRVRSPLGTALALALFVSVLGTPRADAQAASGDIGYVYDDLGRLVAVSDAASDSAVYDYDAVGNILSIARHDTDEIKVIEFTPDSGPAGSTVTIFGTGFGATPGDNTVEFSDTTATVTSASARKLEVTVPSGATDGTIEVTSPAGTAQSEDPFDVAGSKAPTISSISSSIGKPGDSVTISGSNFDPELENNRTVLNATHAVVGTADPSSLTIRVPRGAGSGRVAVGTSGGRAVGPDFFVVPDPYLPADVDTRKRTALGFSETVTVSAAGHVGLLAFDGIKGHRLSLLTTGLIGACTTLDTYGPNGEFEDANGANTRGSTICGSPHFKGPFVLPETGTYVALVDPNSGTATGTITLTPYDVPPDPTAEMSVGEPATLETSTPGQNASITFEGAAGQRRSIRVTHTKLDGTASGARYDYVLSDPDGAELDSGAVTSTDPRFIDTLSLPKDGTYRLAIDPAGEHVGRWTGELFDVPADTEAEITPGGGAVTVTIDAPGQNARYTFPGADGQDISMILDSDLVRTAGSTGIDVEVDNPDGSVLFTHRAGATEFYDRRVLAQTGTYTVELSPRGDHTGTMTLTIYDIPDDDVAPITVDGPQATATLDVPGQRARFRFDGTAGQHVSFTLDHQLVRNLGSSGYVLKVFDPGGTEIFTANETADPKFFEPVSLGSTGSHDIFIDPNGDHTGTIKLTLYDVAADVADAITIGGPSVTLTTADPGQNGSLTFTGTSAQTLKLTFTSRTYSTCPQVFWKNPDGTTLGSDTCVNNNDILQKTLTQTGTHTILLDPKTDTTGSLTFALADVGSGSGPQSAQPSGGEGPASEPASAGGEPSGGAPSEPEVPATELVGEVRTLRDRPLAGVTLEVGDSETETDEGGRFRLKNLEGGYHELEIDGTSANRPGKTYGVFEYGVQITPGERNALPFTIWMPEIDTAHTVEISSPTTEETVITTPRIPGLEIRLPKGAVITDQGGDPVNEVSITEIPTDRPPFPLPSTVKTPVYFTLQPGGAYVEPYAQVVYPNTTGEEPGERFDLYTYDAESLWTVYGQAKVSADGTQIVPSKYARIYEFNGAMINVGGLVAQALGWLFGIGDEDGDPVHLRTGVFRMEHTDLFLPDAPPVALTRTYRTEDEIPRAFGIGASHPYDGIFLRSLDEFQEADLILPDGARIHYERTSPGVGFSDAEFESTESPTAFYKSRIDWNGRGWDLTLKDGTTLV